VDPLLWVRFVTGASEKVAAVLLGNEHAAPANVMVTVLEVELVVDAVQLTKAGPRIGVAFVAFGLPEPNTVVILEPAVSAPLELEVKPMVHRAIALAACELPEKVTAVTDVALPITTLAGDPSVGSVVVCTRKVVPVTVPLPGLVIPATRSVAAVLAARAHVPPLSASVMVTVRDDPVAVATEQFVKPVRSVTTGEAGTVKPVPKVTDSWLPARRAPLALGVKPTCHEARAPELCGVPAKVTAVGCEPVMVTFAAAAASVSIEVASEKPV
jgi:hypothetical protein